MRTRMVSAVAALGVLLGTAGLSTPAEAAYPTKPFDIEYGATYARGTVTFKNRSVTVTGTQRAVSSSGCRFIEVWTYAPVGDLDFQAGERVCNGVAPVTVNVGADVPGGAGYVVIKFWFIDAKDNQRVLTSQTVKRA